jgi:hypothetical protein
MKQVFIYMVMGAAMLFFTACGGGSGDTNRTGSETVVENTEMNTVGYALAGKKLYFAGGWLLFDPEMTMMTSFEGGELETRKILRVENNKIYLYSDDEEGIYLYVAEITEGYVDFIKGDDVYGIEDEEVTRAYFSENDLE